MQLVITDSQKQILAKQAMVQSPNESCALLFGSSGKDKLVIKELFLTENTENSPINFTVSNEQLIQGYKEAEEKQLEVIGIFHSHPDSAPFPSRIDKKFMQINPVVWLIFSGISNDFKAYMLESEIIEIPIISP